MRTLLFVTFLGFFFLAEAQKVRKPYTIPERALQIQLIGGGTAGGIDVNWLKKKSIHRSSVFGFHIGGHGALINYFGGKTSIPYTTNDGLYYTNPADTTKYNAPSTKILYLVSENRSFTRRNAALEFCGGISWGHKYNFMPFHKVSPYIQWGIGINMTNVFFSASPFIDTYKSSYDNKGYYLLKDGVYQHVIESYNSNDEYSSVSTDLVSKKDFLYLGAGTNVRLAIGGVLFNKIDIAMHIQGYSSALYLLSSDNLIHAGRLAYTLGLNGPLSLSFTIPLSSKLSK